MQVSDKGLQILKYYEGLRLEAYLCPAGIWTVGWGSTFYEDGKPVKKGDKITKERAEALLPAILTKFEQPVSRHMTVPVKQYEFDAMVLLTFNIGIGNFEKSTLLRKLKAKAPKAEIAAQFAVWNKAKNPKTKVLEPLAGLTKRRAAEAYLFEHGEVKIF